MQEFWIIVESSTHDDLQRGQTCTQITWVNVLAADYDEAACIAAQMVAGRGRMPTRTTPEL